MYKHRLTFSSNFITRNRRTTRRNTSQLLRATETSCCDSLGMLLKSLVVRANSVSCALFLRLGQINSSLRATVVIMVLTAARAQRVSSRGAWAQRRQPLIERVDDLAVRRPLNGVIIASYLLLRMLLLSRRHIILFNINMLLLLPRQSRPSPDQKLRFLIWLCRRLFLQLICLQKR